MNKEIHSIISNLQNCLNGEPWFGRPVYAILNEIDPSIVYKKPNTQSHSLIEMLYHMNTWAEFTLRRIEKDQRYSMEEFEKIDWREINPEEHTWENAVAQFIYLHGQVINKLSEKKDQFLDEKVEFRQYNFRFLLNGLVQHDIYHLGQIAYLSKAL